jgi:hypothetical protein
MQGLPAVAYFSVVGLNEASHDAKQGAFARARLPQQRHDFAFAQSEIDLLQDWPLTAIGGPKSLAHAVEFDDGLRHGMSFVEPSAQECMRSSAKRYRRRQRKWFKPITNTTMAPMPSAMRGKSPAAVICAM